MNKDNQDGKDGKGGPEETLHPWIEPELEARLTALVLGEASDFEREELERLAAERPELGLYRKRLEAMHRMLRELGQGESAGEAGQQDQWRLSPERRAAVLERIGGEAAGSAAVATSTASGEDAEAALPGAERRPPARTGKTRWRPLLQFAAAVIFGGMVLALMFPASVGRRTTDAEMWSFQQSEAEGISGTDTLDPAPRIEAGLEVVAGGPIALEAGGVLALDSDSIAFGAGGDLVVRRDPDAPGRITVRAIDDSEAVLPERRPARSASPSDALFPRSESLAIAAGPEVTEAEALGEGLETRRAESGERGLIAGTGGGVHSAASRTGTTSVSPEIEESIAERLQERTRQADEAARRGSQLMADRDFQGAIDQYRAALDLLPESPFTEPRHRAYARELSRASGTFASERAAEGRYPEALALVEEVLQPSVDPDNIDAKRLLEQLSDPDYYAPAMSPAHLERARRIRLALKTAEGYISLGDYDRADREYRKALNDDRYNTAARRSQEKSERHRTDYYDQAYNSTRARMIREVAAGWEMPVPAVLDPERIDTADVAGHEEKLKSIIIPSVDFAEMPLSEALAYLQQRSVELDAHEPDPSRRGINIVLDVGRMGGGGGASAQAAPADAGDGFGFAAGGGGMAAGSGGGGVGDTRITLRLTNVPLGEALRYTTSLAQLKYKVEPQAVLVVPLSTPDSDLYTNVYSVPPTFLAATEGGAGGGDAADSFADPFADPVRVGGGIQGRRRTAKDILESAGITFAPGSSAIYNPATSQLIVRNTPEQMELVEASIDAIRSGEPAGDSARTLGVDPGAEMVDRSSSRSDSLAAADPSAGSMSGVGAEVSASSRATSVEVPETSTKRSALFYDRGDSASGVGTVEPYVNKPEEGNVYSLSGLRMMDGSAEGKRHQFEVRAGTERRVAEIEIGEPWFLGRRVNKIPQIGEQIDLTQRPEVVEFDGFIDYRGAAEKSELGEPIDFQEGNRTQDRVLRRELPIETTFGTENELLNRVPRVGTINMGAGVSEIDNLTGFFEVTNTTDLTREELPSLTRERLARMNYFEAETPAQSGSDPSVQSILGLTPQVGQASDSAEMTDRLSSVVPRIVGGGSVEGVRLSERTSADSTIAALFPSIDNIHPLPPTLDETLAADEPFSTFSLHVGDVSFRLARAELAAGRWPEAERIRIEEFVNAFDYGDPMPATGERVACRIDQAAHPFLQQRNLLRIAMRTAEAGRAGDTPLRLTVLLDTSGSMERPDRSATVRQAFATLAGLLRESDRITLIGFARQPRLVADAVPGDRAAELADTVATLPSEGGTNLEAALQLGFEKAREHWLDGAQNRLVLLTDGAANLGDADAESLGDLVAGMREAGFSFDAAGVGAEGLNDEILEVLARQGDGRYYLLNRPEDAGEDFAERIAGALRPAAENVKVQVEFNPDRVGAYRLLGFDKHRLETEDFRDDRVGAAEMAAAEAGVAVYQVEARAEGEGDLGTVSVRFRDLESGRMVERLWPIPYQPAAPSPEQADPAIQLATLASQFAAKLAGGPLGDLVDLANLARLAAALPEQERQNERVRELIEMIEQARGLEGEG